MITVFGAEITRVWKLGTLPRSRQITSEDERRAKPIEAVITLKEGYAVSRTRENALFNMLASFTVAFGITRAITWTIREHGGFGPIKDVTVGDRHIHHFLPGGILALAAGGVAIGTKGEKLDKYLAFPFGVGVALVLDEIGAAARARRRLLDRGGRAQRPDRVRGDRDAVRAGLPDPDAAPRRGRRTPRPTGSWRPRHGTTCR